MKSISRQLSGPARQVMLLTKHFWPTSSDATWRLRSLSQHLRRDNWDVQVVTARWHSTWPHRVTMEEVSVCRVEHPPSNQLRQSLFRRSVCEWLDQHAPLLSWIWCDEAGLDSLAVSSHVKVIRGKIPVVVRYCPAELSSTASDSSSWQPSQAVIDACAAATTVVVPNQSAQHQLLRLGLPSEKIVVCSDWMTPAIDRSSATFRSSRQALAEINSDLSIRNQERVVIVPGDLTRQWQPDFLIQAMVPILDRYPHLRLWIHGDGPDRDRLYETLQFHGHHRTVAMPGVFSCLETLLQAADLCLFPAAGVGLSWLLPTCIISGIPVLASSSPDLSWQLGSMAASLTFESQSKDSLQSRLEHWLRQPEELAAAVRMAGQLIRRQTSNAIPRGGFAELYRVPNNYSTATHPSQPRS